MIVVGNLILDNPPKHGGFSERGTVDDGYAADEGGQIGN